MRSRPSARASASTEVSWSHSIRNASWPLFDASSRYGSSTPAVERGVDQRPDLCRPVEDVALDAEAGEPGPARRQGRERLDDASAAAADVVAIHARTSDPERCLGRTLESLCPGSRGSETIDSRPSGSRSRPKRPSKSASLGRSSSRAGGRGPALVAEPVDQLQLDIIPGDGHGPRWPLARPSAGTTDRRRTFEPDLQRDHPAKRAAGDDGRARRCRERRARRHGRPRLVAGRDLGTRPSSRTRPWMTIDVCRSSHSGRRAGWRRTRRTWVRIGPEPGRSTAPTNRGGVRGAGQSVDGGTCGASGAGPSWRKAIVRSGRDRRLELEGADRATRGGHHEGRKRTQRRLRAPDRAWPVGTGPAARPPPITRRRSASRARAVVDRAPVAAVWPRGPNPTEGLTRSEIRSSTFSRPTERRNRSA